MDNGWVDDGWDASLGSASSRPEPGRRWWRSGDDGFGGVGGVGGGVGGTVNRGDLLAGVWCLLGALLAGPLIGLLWAAVSPRLDVDAVLDGSSAALDVQISIDAYFALICVGFGVLLGLLAFWRFAEAGWPVPAGIAAGGFAGSVVAGWLGHRLRSGGVLDRLPPDVNQVIVDLVDVRVRSHGLYLVFPFVALFVLALGIWISSVRADGALSQGPGGPYEPGGPQEPGALGEPRVPRELDEPQAPRSSPPDETD